MCPAGHVARSPTPDQSGQVLGLAGSRGRAGRKVGNWPGGSRRSPGHGPPDHPKDSKSGQSRPLWSGTPGFLALRHLADRRDTQSVAEALRQALEATPAGALGSIAWDEGSVLSREVGVRAGDGCERPTHSVQASHSDFRDPLRRALARAAPAEREHQRA